MTMTGTSKGISLFCCTMFILSILDMMAKYISVMAPPFATTAWRYLIMFLCALVVAKRKDDVVRSFSLLKSFVLIMRGALLGLFGSFMLLSLRLCPLSITVSIVFTMPFFLLVLSKVMLKEEVRPYQWITVCIGFIGMCIRGGPVC